MHPQSGSRIILRGLVFFLTLAALAMIAGFVTYGNNSLALAAPDMRIGASATRGSEGGNCQPWTLMNVPNPRTHHYLNDIDALAPDDIWAVGEYYDENNYTPDTALTMHWDGKQWTIVRTPDAPFSARLTLYGVSALSPNDVWAVGENVPGSESTQPSAYQPLAMHWDGVQWTIVETPQESGGLLLNDVVAIAPNNVWAVGANDGLHATRAMNWDGTAWSIVPTPNGGGFSDDNVLTSISAVSANDIWAVGYIYPKGGTPTTLAIHWNGSQWTRVTTPNPGNYFRRLNGVSAIAANDVWAVGSYSANSGKTYTPLFLHWNGTQWQHVSSPQVGDYDSLDDVYAIAPNDVWAVGTTAACNFCPFQTLTMHWNGTAWTQEFSPNGFRTFSRLEGVTATSPGDVWAVGFSDDSGFPYTSDSLVMRRFCPVATPTGTPPTSTPTRTATAVLSPTATTPVVPGSCTVPSFGPPTNYVVGDGPERVAVGDFNEDGNPDLALVNKDSSNLSVLLGSGGGSFGQATTYQLNAQPSGITVGDYNNDGNLDVAASGWGVNMAMILLGNGSGGFGTATSYGSGSGGAGIATADFNNDGSPDLVVADDGHDTMLVLINNGSGGFGVGTQYDLDWIPTDIAVGDFNNDGNPDVAAPNSFSDNVSVRLGNGAGGFGALTNYNVAANPISIAVTDFNNDGNDDFATSSPDTGNITVRLGNGSGGFGTPSHFPAGNGSMSIGVADFNLDGNLDLAVANVPNNVAVLLGNGSGGFGPVNNFAAGSGPRAVAVGDFNLDDKPDLAITNNSGDSVSVLLNTCGVAGSTATVTPQTTTTGTPVAPSSTTVPGTPNSTSVATSTQSPTGSTATVTVSAVASATSPAVTTPTVCAVAFTDLPLNHTFYANIKCLACNGILSGYSDGTFRPNNDITRGQIAKVVSNAAGFNEGPGAQIYEDVPASNTFYAWINRLSRRGHMGGYNCGGTGEPCGPENRPYFRPNANATRGQLAKIVASAAQITGTPTGQRYADVAEDSTFYVWIEQLSNLGVMGGYPCGGAGEPCDGQNRPYFRPSNNVTRGQASKIVANTFFPNCNP
jgi:hypothetical protein